MSRVIADGLSARAKANRTTEIAVDFVSKVSGKGLSTNDYTSAEKSKLAGIAAGAQANTVTSVAGKTGAVNLYKADVGLGNVLNVASYSKTESDGKYATKTSVATNLGNSTTTTTVTVTSSTGSNTALAAATTTLAGVMTAADKTKLSAVGTNANRNLTISTGAPSGGANGDVWYQYE